MHVADKTQVLLVLGCLADGLPPFFNQLEDLVLYASRPDLRTLWEAADQLVQKLLGTDLEMEGVAAVLGAYVEKL